MMLCELGYRVVEGFPFQIWLGVCRGCAEKDLSKEKDYPRWLWEETHASVFLLERLANFTILLLFIKNLFNTKFKLGPFPSKKT